MNKKMKRFLAGSAAGAVTGLLGAGGGLVIVHALASEFSDDPSGKYYAAAAVMLPIAMVSLLYSGASILRIVHDSVYLISGSILGGTAAALYANRIAPRAMHLVFNLFVLISGVRLIL